MQHTHAAIRDEEPEAGFTLIELMVVVLIIAILIAILIPTFVGAKQRAQDRAVQASLRNGLTAAKAVYSDRGDYTLATVAGLTAVEPSLSFVAAASASSGPNSISVDPVSTSYVVLAGLSKSGSCFFLSDDMSAAGLGAQYAMAASGGCSASAAPAPGDPAWGAAW
jgi:type IV pilus assembly protein PilA